MRVPSDLFPLLAVMKEMHKEILALRKDIDALRDEVKTMEHGVGWRMLVSVVREDESDGESDQGVPPSL